MENFVVSARKYRPSTFDTVVGQQSITNTLKRAIKNKHVAQAFLFCGPRGVGKTTCARILAKTLNCFNISENVEPCNECESCKSFNEGHSLNIYELDAASNNTVDDIRGLIEQVRIAPQLGSRKIYIIDEVHMLSQQAFNAFLKTLEEPPKHAIFILATTEKHKILPTILSRCQIFDFNRIQVNDIAQHLQFIAGKENITAEPDALHIIAQKADGALRDSLSMFDRMVSFSGEKLTYQDVIQNLNILDYDYFFRITEALEQGDTAQLLLIFNEILENGFDGQNFIVGLGEHFRNLMVAKDQVTIQLLEVGDNIRERYLQQALATDLKFLNAALQEVSKCDVSYKASKNPRLLVEITLLKIAGLKDTPTEKKNITPLAQPNKSSQPAPPTPQKEQPTSQPEPKPTPQAETAPTQTTSPKPEPEPEVQPEAKQQEEKPKPSVSEPESKPNYEGKTAEQIKNRTVNKAPSIKDLRNKNKQTTQSEQQGSSSPEEPVYQGKEEYITIDDIHQAWKVYAQRMQENNKDNFSATMLSHLPQYKGDRLELVLENEVQKAEYDREVFDLLAYLKQRLKNNSIAIDVVIDRTETNNGKPYLPLEKFKAMAEKNPTIVKLRDAFGLDVE